MPSPFPGMDPYLEHPDIFPDLHDSFVTVLKEFLQSRLPESYYAGSGTRVWVETSERFIEPDVKVLSLTNKTPGAHGRDLYVRKQQEILRSQTHLIEIDLLRSGEHTTAVPLQRAVARTGPFDYHVCVHRFDNLEDYLVCPIRLEDRLPEIMVPLLPGDADVTIDLQAVFDRCYEIGPYRRQVRYDSDKIGRAHV